MCIVRNDSLRRRNVNNSSIRFPPPFESYCFCGYISLVLKFFFLWAHILLWMLHTWIYRLWAGAFSRAMKCKWNAIDVLCEKKTLCLTLQCYSKPNRNENTGQGTIAHNKNKWNVHRFGWSGRIPQVQSHRQTGSKRNIVSSFRNSFKAVILIWNEFYCSGWARDKGATKTNSFK